MNKVVILGAPRAVGKEVELLPGSNSCRVPVDMRYSRTFADLMRRGAPQTDGIIISDFEDRRATFPKFPTVSGRIQVLLVTLSGFTMARKLDKWVAENGLVPIDWPTLLTLCETYPTLSRDLKLKSIRLVSLAHVFAYQGTPHVCTVHQDDYPEIVRRIMVYESAKGGWGKEHILCFQI